MSEENNLINKPKKIWNDALKMVKGENNTQLVEQFTAEMTLVAEGLCEDQNKLRGEVDKMLTEEDRRIQKLDARLGQTESLLEEQQREHDQIVTELRNRLSETEKQLARMEKDERNREREKKKKERNLIRDITILIGIAAAAVILVHLVLKYV